MEKCNNNEELYQEIACVTDKMTNRVMNNNYIYTKAAEELNELATILLQKSHKPQRVKDQEIIDEIGDVQIRIIQVTRFLKMEERVTKRIRQKLNKFLGYIINNKYTHI
jgi:Mg2+ and Co2+ transporter CorA